MTTPESKPAEKRVTPLTFILQGRINGSRVYEGVTYTHVTTPAPDAYSMPSQFEVRSEQRLGDQGQEIQVRCQLSGFTRVRSYVDKNTGEHKSVLDRTVNIIAV